MLQAAVLDCQFLDFFPLSDDGFVAPKIDVGGCDVVQALVVALVVVVIDEGPDLMFEIARQIVVFGGEPGSSWFDASARCAGLRGPTGATVPSTALGLRMERRTPNVVHLVIFQPFGQITGDVTGPVVRSAGVACAAQPPDHNLTPPGPVRSWQSRPRPACWCRVSRR